MTDHRILNHVIDIKERLSAIESKQDEMRDALTAHAKQDAELREEVDEVRSMVTAGAAQIALIKWLVGIGVAAVAAVASILRYLK